MTAILLLNKGLVVRKILLPLAMLGLLAGCAQPEPVEPVIDQPEPEVSEPAPIEPQPLELTEVIGLVDRAIICDEADEVFEGDFQTVVCDQGVIRVWEEQLPAEAFGPWPVWCQPALAAGDEPDFEVVYGLNFIVENHNTDSPGLAEHPEISNLCVDLSELPMNPIDADYQTTYGFLTGLADAGLCFEPTEIVPGNIDAHICSGFGAQEQRFQLWLETGEIDALVEAYKTECGQGIVGTFGDDWVMTSFEGDLLVGPQTLGELLSLASPVPFSGLCGEELG
jgi:hypothetical protein